MGTRGLFGVVADKKVKVAYNHYDSYPECLGLMMLGSAKRIASDFENYFERARKLKLVSDHDGAKKPTPAEIKKLSRFADAGVSTGKIDEWYVLLRSLQGDLLGTLDAGYMIDSESFAQDSLFCEYGWVISFDDATLECYRGFVKSQNPPPKGRFFQKVNTDPPYPGAATYQCIHLLGSFPLNQLPEENDFLEKVSEWYHDSEFYFGEKPEVTASVPDE